ncbi:MAG TPA: N-acetyl-alpha-D-glucosaminyl L-malate synthase BshA [Spirochaetia bacterium]|nr:N-acetyl-alpha-D-glucosaminyl L-malate synthase BshA [Spirochaetia bacterium]
MRIGICCYPTAGGSGIVATELGKHLAERGHSVAFISYANPLRLQELPPRVCYHEVDQDSHPLLKQFPHSLTLTAKMVEVARTHKLQIMHVHYAIPFAAAAILARQIAPELQLKVVTTLHGTDITVVGGSPSFKPVTEFSIDQSDAVTAVSTYLRDETYRQLSLRREIDVVYNFVDPQRHHAHTAACRPDPDPGRQVTLMHISNFRPLKRLGDVVRIFARVREKMNARLVLVGDGPEYGRTRELVESLGLEGFVHYVGVVDEVAPLLKAADVLLLPSETESFGLVALEAMASGVPVVATDVGGLPEVVVHGKTGFLAPVGDIDAMAGYCLQLLQDCPTLKRFARAARKRAADFDYRVIVPQYEAVYEKALAEPVGALKASSAG